MSYPDKLKFPEFDLISPYTKTFIVATNIYLNISKLFNFLPITKYTIIPKKRGRKKKTVVIDPNKNIPSGSIITLEYQNKIRGVDLKKKGNKNRKNYFRNSLTIVMIINKKKINYKVCKNGNFQLTGCNKDEHAEKCIKYLWDYIKDHKTLYKIINRIKKKSKKDDIVEQDPMALYIPVMRNIDFSLNFLVDRTKLDEYFNMCTDYHSLLETSFGYTGVNIKIPLKKSILSLQLKQTIYKDGQWHTEPTCVSYETYLKMLPEKEVQKKLKKERYNTFLVFHSGKVIMSGLDAAFMKDVYYEFLSIIRECYHIIKEQLDV